MKTWIMICCFISGFGLTYIPQKKEMSNMIGKKIVLENDTLLVTGYSLLKNNYYLVNGATLDYCAVKKNKIKIKVLANEI